MDYTFHYTTALLEIGPKSKMRLFYVIIYSLNILIHFVEEKLIRIILRSENILYSHDSLRLGTNYDVEKTSCSLVTNSYTKIYTRTLPKKTVENESEFDY